MLNESTDGGKSKTFKQALISSYFTGCRSIPTMNNQKKQRKVTKRVTRIERTYSTCSSTVSEQSRFCLPSDILELALNITEKKLLPAPIFSDDSDSENNATSNDETGGRTTSKRPMTLISLNKPSSKHNLSLEPDGWEPQITSTPVVSKNINVDVTMTDVSSVMSETYDGETTIIQTLHSKTVTESPSGNTKPNKKSNTSSREKIKILNQTIINSPSKSAKKENNLTTVKTEEKKLNFDALNIMNDFFQNLLKTNSLKCLLSEEEKQTLLTFFNTDNIKFKYTCIKLFVYKPIWYNVFKYTEKINLQMPQNEVMQMYNYLKENGFIDTNYKTESSHTLLHLLGLAELRKLFHSFKFPKTQLNKSEMIEKLLKNCATQSTLTNLKTYEQVLKERIERHMGFCMRLKEYFRNCLYKLFLLNTFTNPNFAKPQDYISSVGYFNMVFPEYKVEDFHIFYTPEEFTSYMEARKCYNQYEETLEKKDYIQMYQICTSVFEKLQQMLNERPECDNSRIPYLERFSAISQYVSLLTSGSKCLSAKHPSSAKEWLEFLISQPNYKHKRGIWYCQLSKIETKMKNFENVASLLIKALSDEREFLSEVNLYELAHRASVLNQKRGSLCTLLHDQLAALLPPPCEVTAPQTIVDRMAVRTNESGRKRKYVQQQNGDKVYLTVEETAIDYYKSIGYPKGEHCEGRLICCIFLLLFWDIIYDYYVKGTFVTSKQSAPLDMFTKYFYLNRQEAIKNRLQEITKWPYRKFKDVVIENWTLHSHEESLLRIDTFVKDYEELFDIIECIGRNVLAIILERLVVNYRNHHSGFPDLIVWNVENKTYKFVEVKGENDKLSINQKLWLQALMEAGAHVEVCHIHSTGSKKKMKYEGKSLKSA